MLLYFTKRSPCSFRSRNQDKSRTRNQGFVNYKNPKLLKLRNQLKSHKIVVLHCLVRSHFLMNFFSFIRPLIPDRRELVMPSQGDFNNDSQIDTYPFCAVRINFTILSVAANKDVPRQFCWSCEFLNENKLTLRI